MSRGFGGTAFEPTEESRDRELTLGPAALIGLALALFAVCAVCFFWGYSTGHRNSADGVAPSAAASAPSVAQLLSGQSKPAPNQATLQPHADVPDSTSADAALAAAPPPTNAAGPVTASYSPANPAQPANGNPVVQPALQGQQAAVQLAAAGQVQSALGQSTAQGTAWMVQIAAVSHTEDADVLVSALRKRGYVVSSRRDPADNLMHVQVGPFATHADAASMRQRLLNDGYNAIIEP